MPNINSNPANVASATLAAEVHKPQGEAPPQAAAPTAASLSKGENLTYTVQKGDTLWDIAGVQLNDPTQWPKIHALNKSIIANPDLIFPGQVLTLPKTMPAPSPAAPQPSLPSPVPEPPAQVETPPTPVPISEPVVQPNPAPPEPPPAPAAPEPPPAAPEPPPAPPVAVDPEPAPPAPVEPPAAVEDPPAVPYPTELRHPSELPPARPDVPLDTPVAPVDAEPIQGPAQPDTPAQVPTDPADIQPVPAQPDPAPPSGGLADQVNQVTGNAPQSASSGVGKAALIGGAIGTAGTAGALMYATSKIGSNLGGYATAQVVAKGVNNVIGKVGLSVPTGPALSSAIKSIGGPKVAGAATAVGVGLAVAGVAAGGYYLYNKATGGNEKAAAQPQPTPQAPAPSDAPAAIDIGDISPVESNAPVAPQQPTQTPEAPQQVPAGDPQLDQLQPTVDLTQGFNKLNEILNSKSYFGLGGLTDPAALTEVSNQLWTQGGVEDRVQLGSTLVNNGQAKEFGRILVNSGVQDVEIAQVLSHQSFPVSQFMKDIDNSQAGIILTSLGNVAAQGHDPSSQALSKIVQAYDGRFRDREQPFESMKNQMTAQGNWAQLPNPLQVSISELLK